MVVVATWLGVLVAVWWAGRTDRARPAAAIVVLGAAQYDGRPSPVLRARLDHAVTLWREGIAPRVIVTGGRRAGDRTTEAAAGRRYVVAHGVPDSAVLLESEGQSTSASLRTVAALLRELQRTALQRTALQRAEQQRPAARPGAVTPGGPGTSSGRAGTATGTTVARRAAEPLPTAVLVSDPFHMLRLGILARRYGIAAYTSPTPTSPISANRRLAWSYLLRETLKVPVALLIRLPDDD